MIKVADIDQNVLIVKTCLEFELQNVLLTNRFLKCNY
jgi:hypothetical protein